MNIFLFELWNDSTKTMGNLYYRPNFDPVKMNEIIHHSSKEHVKTSRIAKFGC